MWGLSGRKNPLLVASKKNSSGKYSSASDDPVSDNGLPYLLSPVYAWGPQRNNRAWQAKKCVVIGTQWILKNEWRTEWMTKWTEHPFFPGWQCSFCSSEGICQPIALWSASWLTGNKWYFLHNGCPMAIVFQSVSHRLTISKLPGLLVKIANSQAPFHDYWIIISGDGLRNLHF